MTFCVSFDRNYHVGDHPIDHHLPVQLTKVAKRRTSIVVHQDVRLGARFEQRSLPLRRGNIGLYRDDGRTGRLADIGGGLFQHLRVAAIDDYLATRRRKCLSASTPEPAT
jgi:hypothetical protein